MITQELSHLLKKDYLAATQPKNLKTQENLNTLVFNYLNHTFQMSDFLIMFQNLDTCKIIFFNKFLSEVESIQNRTDLSATLRIITGHEKKFHQQPINDHFVKKFRQVDPKIVNDRTNGITWMNASNFDITKGKDRNTVAKLNRKAAGALIFSTKGDFSQEIDKNLPIDMQMVKFLYLNAVEINCSHLLFQGIEAHFLSILQQAQDDEIFIPKLKIITKFFEILLQKNYHNKWVVYEKIIEILKKSSKLKVSLKILKSLLSEEDYIRDTFLGDMRRYLDSEALKWFLDKFEFEDENVDDFNDSREETSEMSYLPNDQQNQMAKSRVQFAAEEENEMMDDTENIDPNARIDPTGDTYSSALPERTVLKTLHGNTGTSRNFADISEAKGPTTEHGCKNE